MVDIVCAAFAELSAAFTARVGVFHRGVRCGLGIDLGGDGVTRNDLGDADGSPNHLQNFPLVTAITPTPAGEGKTSVPICLCKHTPAWPLRHVTTLSSCEVEAAAKASAI